MTDLTPEQRATQIRKLVFDWINLDQKDFPWPALDSKIAAEIRAAEQAAREKALRDAAAIVHERLDEERMKARIEGDMGKARCLARAACCQSLEHAILRLEEKND